MPTYLLEQTAGRQRVVGRSLWRTGILASVAWVIAASITLARNWLLSWLQQRVPSGVGKPLASLSRVQEIVGKIEALLLVNQSLLQRVATQGLSSEQANLAKVTITENAIEVVSKSLELTGNHGLSRHHPLECHYRNVLCGRVHTPQNDSAWINAGKQALTDHLNRQASASKEDK